jgi:site-specific DNA recombinase
MTSESKKVTRCAIYTRKSSEEGLEQSFNSLDAQREACEAFIASQRHEGWRTLGAVYDDGGFSGGTLARPAMQRLLQDIEADKIDTVVVYKVDRLTRSLADFAKIVEALDARAVSFVSVTQQFNTTTSMGRLTLNILLSFAQFEREVTGERIRDKIAASKRKGMWMGGTIPLGYDLKERKLLVNPDEAKQVNRLFQRYLEVQSVTKLKSLLDAERVKSKLRISVAGNRSGQKSYSRGALYDILQNRLYLGEIHHKGLNHPGEHAAIVPRELWDRVQSQLKSDHQGGRKGLRANSPSLLVGRLQDPKGNCFTPAHASKNGRRYRYYVRPATTDGAGTAGKALRLPAHDVERQVIVRLQSFLRSGKDVMDALCQSENSAAHTRHIVATAAKQSATFGADSNDIGHAFVRRVVSRVVVHPDRMEVQVDKHALRSAVTGEPQSLNGHATQRTQLSGGEILRLNIDALLKRCGGEVRLVLPPDHSERNPPQHSTSLLKALARAQTWREWILAGEAAGRRSIAKRTGLDERYVGQVLVCAFLAPDIVQAILDGRQPTELTFAKLTRSLPLNWSEQRTQLGFPALLFSKVSD